MLLAAVLAGITGLISAWALRRGFAVVASIVVLIVVSGVVLIVQNIADYEGIDTVGEIAGLFSPWTLHNGLAEAWEAGGRATIVLPARGRSPTSPPRWSSGQPAWPARTPLREGGFAMSTLVLDKVSRWFGNVVAVNDVTMTIGPGVTGLLGPNGAGKTTLMAMMSGFLPPSSGTVHLDGEPVWRHTDAYRQIGLVPSAS